MAVMPALVAWLVFLPVEPNQSNSGKMRPNDPHAAPTILADEQEEYKREN